MTISDIQQPKVLQAISVIMSHNMTLHQHYSVRRIQKWLRYSIKYAKLANSYFKQNLEAHKIVYSFFIILAVKIILSF